MDHTNVGSCSTSSEGQPGRLASQNTLPPINVYAGKGELVKRLNEAYNAIISQHTHEHWSVDQIYTRRVARNAAKLSVAEKVYHRVTQSGGRFFDQQGLTMSKEEAIGKVKKALKDKKYQAKSAHVIRHRKVKSAPPLDMQECLKTLLRDDVTSSDEQSSTHDESSCWSLPLERDTEACKDEDWQQLDGFSDVLNLFQSM